MIFLKIHVRISMPYINSISFYPFWLPYRVKVRWLFRPFISWWFFTKIKVNRWKPLKMGLAIKRPNTDSFREAFVHLIRHIGWPEPIYLQRRSPRKRQSIEENIFRANVRFWQFLIKHFLQFFRVDQTSSAQNVPT